MPPISTAQQAKALEAGAALFDRGAYWHAHEVWEAAWRCYAGTDRHYFRGLIQIAAMNFHLQRGNRGAARRLLDSAVRNLHGADPLAWPFDCAHVTVALAALAAAIDGDRAVRPLKLRLRAMLNPTST